MISKEDIEVFKTEIINIRKKNSELLSNSLTSLKEQEILLETINIIDISTKYIEQLETDKQKIIETLEKVLKENKAKTDCKFCNNTCDSYQTCKALEKALKIMKGENDE